MVILHYCQVHFSQEVPSVWLLFLVFYQTKLKNKKTRLLAEIFFCWLDNMIINYPEFLPLLHHDDYQYVSHYKILHFICRYDRLNHGFIINISLTDMR